MSPEKKIRIQARNRLGDNNWPAAVGVTLAAAAAIMTVIYLISAADIALVTLAEMLGIDSIMGEEILVEGTVSGSLLIPGIVLLVPLFMGVLRYFYLLTKNGDADFAEVFYYIGPKYIRTLGVTMGVFVRCLWQAAVSFLPAYIGYVAISARTMEKDKLAFSDIICYFIVYALLFGGILLFSKLCTRYFLCMYLYIEDENLSVSELCARSEMYMQRFSGSVMKLILSLFPWMLSCILIIPCLFVIPYVMASLSTSAKWIIALYHQSENKDE